MSLWGRTVITSLASALPLVGTSIVGWLWGGFAVDNPTLNRFYSFHYLFPFLLAALSQVHLAALHQYGSTNPLGINAQGDLIDFYPYFYSKDLVAAQALSMGAAYLVSFNPELLGHPDNNIPANPYSTPAHIVPEWYFRAPMCHYSRWHLIMLGIIAFILLCKMCRKTLIRQGFGNEILLSGFESSQSEGGFHNNSMRVMNCMDKLMNLIYSPSVPPCTLALLLLMGIIGLEFSPGNGELPYALIQGYVYQTMFFYNGLQGPNQFYSGNNGTLALPKGRKVLGKRSFVVGNNNRMISNNQKDIVAEGRKANSNQRDRLIIPQGCEMLLDQLHNSNDPDRRGKLIHYVADMQTLMLAYELIKSKVGNMTHGADKETLNGVTLNYLRKISMELRSGKYKFTPARRIYIPQPGMTQKQPLSIASLREKVVQKAMELVQSIIYEPMFLPCSHGFRPNKSTHSALKMIHEQSKGAAWFIQADITKCFEQIDHKKLIDMISQEIPCQKTLALIHSRLKAGYVEPGSIAHKAMLGTPQGSVLSPLLCNIYLHELDKFMIQVIQSHDKGSSRRQNPAYTRLCLLIRKANSLAEKKILGRELRKTPRLNPMDSKFVRVRYIRYANDFLISVIGPHKLAVEIKELLRHFLREELGQPLNKSKTFITSAVHEKVFFLGTYIQWLQPVDKEVVRTKRGIRSRVTARMRLLAPIDKLITKLIFRQFMKWNHDGTKLIATGVGRLINLDHSDIIAYYNAVIREILSYYTFADNRSSLRTIVRYMHMSCARTLCLKYKLRTRAKTYKKYGSLLTCPDTKVSLFRPKTFVRVRQFNQSSPTTLEMLKPSWTNKLTRINLGKSCIICGGIPAEMHNVRAIKQLKSRKHLDWFTMQMAAINRKQVPLCRKHDLRQHKNRLTEAK